MNYIKNRITRHLLAKGACISKAILLSPRFLCSSPLRFSLNYGSLRTRQLQQRRLFLIERLCESNLLIATKGRLSLE